MLRKKQQSNKRAPKPPIDPASTDNLVGFFALLLEIDKRKNPHLYAASKSDQRHA